MKPDKFEESKKDIKRILLISYNCFEIYNKFWFLRAPNMVGKNDAELNVKMYKDFGNMFVTFEESLLCTFSIIFRQLFDKRSDSVSLYSVNKVFNKNLGKEIDELSKNYDIQIIIELRHKFFAHRDNTGKYNKRLIPSYDSIKEIYNQIYHLFWKITGEHIFLVDSSADELESLFLAIKKSNSRRFL